MHRPTRLGQRDICKTSGHYRALAWQALSCSIPGGRFHHQLPVMDGAIYGKADPALRCGRPGRRLPGVLPNSTLKGSLHRAQDLTGTVGQAVGVFFVFFGFSRCGLPV